MRGKILATISCLAIISMVSEAVAVEWNVSLWGKRRAFTEHVEKLAELVSTRTNGEFRLNLSYGGLAKNRENLDGIAAGAFEMAQFCSGYHPEKNPSLTVLELPFLGITSLEMERRVSQASYTHPTVVNDLARWNAVPLMPSPLPQYNLVGVGPVPRSLGQLAGLRVRAVGGVGRAMKFLGASPVSLTASEVREAMLGGAVDAVAFAPHAHMAFGTVETGSWWTTNLNPGTVNCPVVVSSQALKALSTSHRSVLISSVDEALDHYVANYQGKTMSAWGPTLENRRIQKVTFSKSEISALRDAVNSNSLQNWMQENMVRDVPVIDLIDLLLFVLTEIQNES